MGDETVRSSSWEDRAAMVREVAATLVGDPPSPAGGHLSAMAQVVAHLHDLDAEAVVDAAMDFAQMAAMLAAALAIVFGDGDVSAVVAALLVDPE